MFSDSDYELAARVLGLPVPRTPAERAAARGAALRERLELARAAPTRGILGGVAEYTCDIITLCESSGVDTVLIESVGVGM